MALLPPIPARPSDRPETWSEYCARRGVLTLHRQLYDDLTSWLKSNPPPLFDPFEFFGRRSLLPVFPNPHGTRFQPLRVSDEMRRCNQFTI